ncbi:hypothetical protein ARZXY2_4329 (plasmid) [Arthrobacter sp. ZXY-2]|nr:hypothetical protein ARZXY2_4329 [Arthrobacter sp. ZXY-2]
MSAAVGTCLLVFLRRAGILTGMLALIAGIFGMHVLSVPTTCTRRPLLRYL